MGGDAPISSTLEEMKRHVIPSSESLAKEITRAERKQSTMLTARKSVSGIRYKRT